MPCNCDHLEPHAKELELSRVACLLDELKGKPLNKSHWDGYHHSVYGKAVDGDKLTASLCDWLQKLDVKKQSLEMQIWWRDHQAADKARIQREVNAEASKRARAAALAKLTPHERRLLGF